MPSNSPHGYPYPLPTEPVAEGAQAIRNLAEAIDAKAPGMQVIQEVILAADAANITFSAIPQIYNHLLIAGSAASRLGSTPDLLVARFNDDGTAMYGGAHIRGRDLAGNATTGPQGNNSVAELWPIPGVPSGDSARQGNGVAFLPGARSAGSTPAGLARFIIGLGGFHTGALCYLDVHGVMWWGTGAISKITLFPLSTQNFVRYSRLTLYGLRGLDW